MGSTSRTVLLTAAAAAWAALLTADRLSAQSSRPSPANQSTPKADKATPPANKPVKKPRQQARPEIRWFSYLRYDEPTSRAAFEACDGSGDDRLSIFEARQCLERMGTMERPDGFRRLDTNRDGQLSWPEFDRYYKEVCGRGGRMRFKPMRPFQRPPSAKREPPERLAATHVLRLGDADKDGRLSQKEFKKLIAEFKQPVEVAQAFPLMDADRSGDADLDELVVLVRTVPALLPLAALEDQRRRSLAGADVNKDGKVSLEELTFVLHHLHPTLGRWAQRIFHDADADEDGELSGDELGDGSPKKEPR